MYVYTDAQKKTAVTDYLKSQLFRCMYVHTRTLVQKTRHVEAMMF